MQNVVLIIHLLLAVGLIAIVLLQRSEGGGLGIGGGGGNGVMSGRAAATALGKATWILAIAFICTSLTLTVIEARNTSGSSVLDRLAPAAQEGSEATGDSLLPPTTGDEPLLPVAE